jgi:hypothetical protein
MSWVLHFWKQWEDTVIMSVTTQETHLIKRSQQHCHSSCKIFDQLHFILSCSCTSKDLPQGIGAPGKKVVVGNFKVWSFVIYHFPVAKVDVLHPSSCLLKGYVQCMGPSTTHCSVLTSIPGDPFPLLTEPVSLPHNSPFPEYIVQQHNINGWSYIPIHLYSLSTMNHIREISTCTLSILITEIFTGH